MARGEGAVVVYSCKEGADLLSWCHGEEGKEEEEEDRYDAIEVEENHCDRDVVDEIKGESGWMGRELSRRR